MEEGAPPAAAPVQRTVKAAEAALLSEIVPDKDIRTGTGTGELDRVLGGGLVAGSVILLSGEPGIGKSTLLLQISDALGREKRVLYVSGEESRGQIKLRADRLGAGGADLFLASETDLDSVLAAVAKVSPDILIVDSIQTMYSSRSRSAALISRTGSSRSTAASTQMIWNSNWAISPPPSLRKLCVILPTANFRECRKIRNWSPSAARSPNAKGVSPGTLMPEKSNV